MIESNNESERHDILLRQSKGPESRRKLKKWSRLKRVFLLHVRRRPILGMKYPMELFYRYYS